MIAHLTGNVIYSNPKYIVLNVNGVGYKVHCNMQSQEEITTPTSPLEKGASESALISFFIHTVVREDALELFGFNNQTELQFFEKLISISGIGPRGGLGILNAGSVDTLTKAISEGDLGYLTAVSGIGKKTAEKIILELRGSIQDILESGGSGSNKEVVLALKALGYSERDAQMASKNVQGNTSQEKIKNALKGLSK